MKLVSLALRNLFRNTRRTLLTTAAIGFGLALMLFVITLQKGMYTQLVENGVSAMAGHVVVQQPGYQEQREEALVVGNATEISTQMQAAFPDATVAPRIFLQGLITAPTGNVGAGLSAVQPVAEAKVSWFDDKLVEGEWLDSDRDIVLGRTMADTLGVELGDKVVYMGQHDGKEMASRMFRVKGVFATGSADIDGFTAVIHIDAARALMNRSDVAHQVTLHLADAAGADDAATTVRALPAVGESLAVLTWRQAVPELIAYIQMDRSSGDVMMAVIALIVAMGVLNTVLMSVLERTREFGVLLAIGLKPRQLSKMVLFEGLLTGLMGATIGLLLGGLLSYPLVAYGLDLSTYVGGESMETGGVPMDSLMRGGWDPVRSAIYFTLAIVFTGLAAAYPAWHVSRLQPVDAMR